MRRGSVFSAACLVSVLLMLSPTQSNAMEQQGDTETSKVPSSVQSILSTLNVLGNFIEHEKNTAKRNLLIRRLNRLSDRANTLTNTENFQSSLNTDDLDIDRALDNVAAIKGNLDDVRKVLQTIINDLSLQDQVSVTELQIRLRSISVSRAGALRNIEDELRGAKVSGKIGVRTIKDHAERAHSLAQQLQHEIAEFLQNLRSSPVR